MVHMNFNFHSGLSLEIESLVILDIHAANASTVFTDIIHLSINFEFRLRYITEYAIPGIK